LTSRTPDELAALAPDASPHACRRLQAEETGVNLLLEVRRAADE